MEVKRYFANTVEEALAMARHELGEEALLLESRRSAPADSRSGAYEVVVGIPSAPPPPAPSGEPSASQDELAQELRDLRGLLSSVHAAVNGVAGMVTRVSTSSLTLRRPDLEPLAAQLEDADLPSHHVETFLQHLASFPAASAHGCDATLRAALRRFIESRLAVDSQLGRMNHEQQIVALIGPPGAGKTTTLIKLAIRYGLARRRSTALLTTDTYRIAAADQLKAYSAILGLPCGVVEHGAGLANAIDEFRHKDLILIDTPGFSMADWDLACDWSRHLVTTRGVDTHLVLSATTRSADLARMLASWSIFAPSRLIITHMDETSAMGGVLTAGIDGGIPYSFFCSGQNVPDDLEPANLERLLAFLASPTRSRTAAAAGF